MTVAELMAALRNVPPGALVLRAHGVEVRPIEEENIRAVPVYWDEVREWVSIKTTDRARQIQAIVL